MDSRKSSAVSAADNHRQSTVGRPVMAGISVREEDIEPVKGVRAIAMLFRGMAVLLLLLMLVQVVFGFTNPVPASPGVLLADAVRLIIFAGLLWGGGDLAVLGIKSHYDLRATRILMARVAYMVRQMGEASGTVTPSDQTSRADRQT